MSAFSIIRFMWSITDGPSASTSSSAAVSQPTFSTPSRTAVKQPTLQTAACSKNVFKRSKCAVASLREDMDPSRYAWIESSYEIEMRIESDPKEVAKKLAKNRELAASQKLRPCKQVFDRTGNPFKELPKIVLELLNSPAKNSTESGKWYYGRYPGSYSTLLNGALGEAEHIGIGGRIRQEDRYIAVEFMVAGQQIRLTGIFDGHGGIDAAEFTRKHLQQCLEYRLNEFSESGELTDLAIYNALKIAFIDLDRLAVGQISTSGTTATIQLMIGDFLWIANIGDSRTIGIGTKGEIIQLSEDMEFIPRFTKGIAKRQGKVIFKTESSILHLDLIKGHLLKDEKGALYAFDRLPVNLRLGGCLNMPRAIGDHALKGLCRRCKIVKIRKQDIAYTVHACDGITYAMDTFTIGNFIRYRIARGDSLAQAAKTVIDFAILLKSLDNLSVQIVDNFAAVNP